MLLLLLLLLLLHLFQLLLLLLLQLPHKLLFLPLHLHLHLPLHKPVEVLMLCLAPKLSTSMANGRASGPPTTVVNLQHWLCAPPPQPPAVKSVVVVGTSVQRCDQQLGGPVWWSWELPPMLVAEELAMARSSAS